LFIGSILQITFVNLGIRKKDVGHTHRGNVADSNRSNQDRIGSENRSVGLHLYPNLEENFTSENIL
jgi:hypothetical protein